jgi:serine/threonine-protein kinase
MAFVYLGNRDGRRVAVKVLNDRARRDVKLEKRFRREWQILQELHHANVLGVFDFGFAPIPYLVSEYCPLGTVRDLLRKSGRLSSGDAVRIARQAALGLRAALEIGVVHRDINPRNLLRVGAEAVKVGDFGIAHWDRETLTTHEVLGTPGYLSPEICAGRTPDWRADQYALGVTLFEMVAGRRPFGNQHMLDLVDMQFDLVPDLQAEPVAGVGDELANVVRIMMSKEPAGRFGSYDALIEALDRSDRSPS